MRQAAADGSWLVDVQGRSGGSRVDSAARTATTMAARRRVLPDNGTGPAILLGRSDHTWRTHRVDSGAVVAAEVVKGLSGITLVGGHWKMVCTWRLH